MLERLAPILSKARKSRRMKDILIAADRIDQPISLPKRIFKLDVY